MADFQPIYKNRELFVPTFEIYVRGQGLPGDVLRDVVSVTYKDGVDQIDSFDLSVNNWDAATFDFKYTGAARPNARGERVGRIFEPGQTIELWMGYRSPAPGEPSMTRLMLAGIITSLSPSFPTGGQPTVSPGVDFAGVALACGYARAAACATLDGFEAALREAMAGPGPALIHLRIAPGSMAKLGRPTVTPPEVAQRFRAFLAAREAARRDGPAPR